MSINRPCLSAMLAGVGAFASATAGAVPFTAYDNISGTTVMGADMSGSFDVRGLLSSSYSSPYSITGGSLLFTFRDDGDATYSHNVTTDYTTTQSCGGSAPCSSYSTRTSTDYYTDEIETARVQVGNATETVGSTFSQTSTQTGVASDWSQTYSNAWLWPGQFWSNSGSTKYYDETSGYSGEFSLAMPLQNDQLSDLADDGILSFVLSSLEGDFEFLDAQLIFEAEEGAAPPPSSAPFAPASGTYTTQDLLGDTNLVGDQVQGMFDVRGHLGSAGDQPYEIVGGSIELTFTDDGELVYSHSASTDYVGTTTCDATQCWTTKERTSTDYYTDASDTAVVQIGATTGTESSPQFESSEFTGTTDDYYESDDSFFYYQDGVAILVPKQVYHYYSRDYDHNSGNAGPFSMTLDLDAEALLDLSEDGLLPFLVSSLEGDFFFDNAKLTIEYAAPDAAQSVPEPGTLPLLGAALLSLVGVRRYGKGNGTMVI